MTQDEESQLRRAWEYHKAADELLAFRMSYGMVAQSMLIVSFVTLLGLQPHLGGYLKASELIVGVFGLWLTTVQHLLARSLVTRLFFLKENYLEKIDPIYRDYMAAYKVWGKSNQLQIMVGMGLVWVALIGVAILAPQN